MSKWTALILSIVFSLNTTQALCDNNNLQQQKVGPGPLFSLAWTGNNLRINTTTPAWFYQFAGITSLTSGFNFSNCTPSNNGNCLFSASDTLTGVPILSGPAVQPSLKLCLNGLGNTYSCEKHQLSYRFAYVMNSAVGTYALCPINSVNGNFDTCRALALGGTGVTQRYGTIAINPAGTFAYVTSEDNLPTEVFNCPINVDGTLGNCTANTSQTFTAPRDVAINKAGTIAYVVNFANAPIRISMCSINSNGTFGACELTGNGFNQPLFMAINSTETIAYVTNFAGGAASNVSVCPINPNGTFGTCSTTGNFTGPKGIALNKTGTRAYVGLADNTISLCSINSNGTFGTCQIVTNLGGGEIFDIVLNSDNTFAYVANRNANFVSQCSINSDGTFGTCNNTGGPYAEPYGIALF